MVSGFHLAIVAFFSTLDTVCLLFRVLSEIFHDIMLINSIFNRAEVIFRDGDVKNLKPETEDALIKEFQVLCVGIDNVDQSVELEVKFRS